MGVFFCEHYWLTASFSGAPLCGEWLKGGRTIPHANPTPNMIHRIRLPLFLLMVAVSGCSWIPARVKFNIQELGRVTANDHDKLYRTSGLVGLSAMVGAAAVMANTSVDEKTHAWYQEDVRSRATDELSSGIKFLGEGEYLVPVMIGAYTWGLAHDSPMGNDFIGEWGERCMRTSLLGAEPLLAMQGVLGASRPGEKPYGSDWRFFGDLNGASGHAFIAAVPLVNAAKMTDSPFWKTTLYASSVVPAIARVNDEAHYPSQAMLGWGMAWLAANMVDQSGPHKRFFSIEPLPEVDGGGVGLVWRR